jgi:hypothetical protein
VCEKERRGEGGGEDDEEEEVSCFLKIITI